VIDVEAFVGIASDHHVLVFGNPDGSRPMHIFAHWARTKLVERAVWVFAVFALRAAGAGVCVS